MQAKFYNFLLYLGQGCFIAYDVLYFEQMGLPLVALSFATVFFDLSCFVSELPLSVFFDHKSPRLVLMLGNLVRLSGFLFFIFDPTSLAMVAIGQALTGIGTAAESGAAQALVLNGDDNPEERDFLGLISQLTFLSSLGTILGALIGFTFFAFYLPGIWWSAALIYLLAGVLLLKVPVRNTDLDLLTPTTLVRDLKLLVTGLVKNKVFWALAFLNWAGIPVVFLWQLSVPEYKNRALGPLVGMLIMNAATALMGRFFTQFEVRASKPQVTAFLLLAIITTVGFGWFNGWLIAFLFFFLHVFFHTACENMLSSQLHATIADNQRASASSCISLLLSIGAVALLPLSGMVASNQGLKWAILLGLPCYLIALVLALTVQRKDQANV